MSTRTVRGYTIEPRADLQGAYLQGANLRGADLTRADLTGAYLQRAYLQRAYLYGASLRGADLQGAYLQGANLRGAHLTGAYLTGADLTGADLQRAYLRGANLQGADLTGTCLDPSNSTRVPSVAALRSAGFTVTGGWVYGYRTRTSQVVVPRTVYKVGKAYTAPWFSTAPTTCHPGLYVSGEAWLDDNNYSQDRVGVRFRRKDCHAAGDKFRVRTFKVVSYHGHRPGNPHARTST